MGCKLVVSCKIWASQYVGKDRTTRKIKSSVTSADKGLVSPVGDYAAYAHNGSIRSGNTTKELGHKTRTVFDLRNKRRSGLVTNLEKKLDVAFEIEVKMLRPRRRWLHPDEAVKKDKEMQCYWRYFTIGLPGKHQNAVLYLLPIECICWLHN